MNELFLIKDGDVLKTISNDELIEIGFFCDLNVNTFLSFGVEKSKIECIAKFRSTLNTDNPKILVYSNEHKIIKIKEKGIPFGSIVEMLQDVDLSPGYINYIKGINITANKGNKNDILKFAISIDKGKKWLTYFNQSWIEILKNDNLLIEKGMNLDLINNLTEIQLKEITVNKSTFKILWFIQKSELDSSLNISNIEFLYSTNL